MQSLRAPTQHCKEKKAHILYHFVFEGGERTEAPRDCQTAHETLSRIFMTLFSQKRKEKKKTVEDRCRGRSLTTITPVSQSCSKNTWAQG